MVKKEGRKMEKEKEEVEVEVCQEEKSGVGGAGRKRRVVKGWKRR